MKEGSKYLLSIFSGIGFLDALFLSYEHFMGIIPPCTPGFQCDVVTTSQYSVILGIPVPYLGFIYYLALFAGSIMLLDNKNVLKYLIALSGIGFLGSLYFTYIQAFVLDAWCLYCIISAITTTMFFITTIFSKKKEIVL